MGSDGTAYVAWWTATKGKGVHGCVAIRNGVVRPIPLQFQAASGDGDNFDLGIHPSGKLLFAYKADLPEDHADGMKLHVRTWDGKRWSEPEKVLVPGEKFFGGVRVVSGEQRTFVSWLAREETVSGRMSLWHSVRRYSVTDGKSWSPPQPLAVAMDFLQVLGSVPVGPISLEFCVDKRGDVHAVWGSPVAYHRFVSNVAKK